AAGVTHLAARRPAPARAGAAGTTDRRGAARPRDSIDSPAQRRGSAGAALRSLRVVSQLSADRAAAAPGIVSGGVAGGTGARARASLRPSRHARRMDLPCAGDLGAAG